MENTGIAIVVLMTLKPDWVGSVTIMVVALLLGLGAGLALGRADQGSEEPEQSYEQAASRS